MYSATFPRVGRAPLRIGPRFSRDGPQLSRTLLRYRIVLTAIFEYLGSSTVWYQLRISCTHIFVFWSNPTEVPDPPVALAFGPHSDSDLDDISDVSG